ncbi:hypothetical protein HF086_013633 [Spodoptera exigua]|uniref:HTH CENPB-type domain-containing protein n=1 Tax=Spodoptera exigua TaxID=7107 RepID=A0A922MA08_SPOEX|nr:hypothetical protein HF086_013633 [Spodoptera exigua]
MPRNYKRTSDRQSWSTESMQKAIEAVRDNKMGWLMASKTFGVPQATLRRHAEAKNKTLESTSKGLGSWKSTFTPDIEKQLVQHLKFLESRLFGLTRTAVQELAFELAERNGISHKFNVQKRKAGQEWLEGFLKRNKDISLRKPEATSAARAQAFNRPQVQKFYELYGKLLESINFRPHRIYNADESGLSTVQNPQKILATTGRKQVGVITSAERGINTTVVCCVNAIGTFIPPMMIFARKNMKNELIDEAPSGTLGVAQQSGWMTTELYLKWMKHFQSFVKSSTEDKVILIVDGHASHKGIETLEYAKQNGIIIVCLPPHCTHRMQPLDVSFFAPLKTYFNQAISKWLKNHPGRVVTQFQIAGLFNEAYGKAATVQNACNGFKSTGIWPLNPEIFPDYMYEPAETTNIPLVDEEAPHATTFNDISDAQTIAFTQPVDNPVQSTSTSEYPSSCTLAVPLEEISPLPRGRFISGQGKRKVKARQTSLVLTSTPNMEEIKSKSKPKDPPEKRRRQITKTLFEEESEGDISPQNVEDDEEDCSCIYCNDLYSRSKPGDDWLRCMKCSLWAHAACADVPKRTKRYICEICQ